MRAKTAEAKRGNGHEVKYTHDWKCAYEKKNPKNAMANWWLYADEN